MPNTTFSILIFLKVILFLNLGLNAQSRAIAGLPILTPKIEVIYQSDLKDSGEYSHIEEIYEKLVEAKGDKRMSVPKLKFRSEEAYVASMDYKLNEITLEKKAYNVAIKYGDAGIAFLLAHELIHHYEKHGWRSQYADAVSDLETGRLLRALDDRMANEVQADVLGGFLAYSAGFGIFDKGGELIDTLYAAYEKENNLKGYPPKKDRIALSLRNAKEIEKLSELHEMAGLLTIVGKYDEATAYYDYLLKKYQSREIFNNAGLTCLLSASSLIDTNIMIFEFPGVLDIEFSGGSRSASNRKRVADLTNQALNHFETAILMDKKYLSSHINIISTYILKSINEMDVDKKAYYVERAGHILDFEIPYLINKYDEFDYDSFKDELLVLKALIQYYKDDRVGAQKTMEEAANLGSDVAIKNLRVMKGDINSNQISPSTLSINIDGMTAEKFLSDNRFGPDLTDIDVKYNFILTNQKSKNYKVLVNEFKGSSSDIAYKLGFVVSKSGFSAPFVDNLTLGVNKNIFQTILGKPQRVLSHLNGEILLYNDKLILITDSNNNVVKVIDYKQIFKTP